MNDMFDETDKRMEEGPGAAIFMLSAGAAYGKLRVVLFGKEEK